MANDVLDGTKVLGAGGELKDGVKVVLDHNNKYFVDATTTIKSVAMQVSESLSGKDAVVTIEKLIVSPTTQVPVSIYVPEKVGSAPAVAELYVDTDKDYTVEWSTTNGEAVTVVPDAENQNKAIITAKKAARWFNIVAVVKIDGQVVATEQSPSMDVDPDRVAYAVNKEATANFNGHNTLLYDGGCELKLDTPITLPKGKKLEAVYSVKKVDKDGKETLWGGALRICMFDKAATSIWSNAPVLASQYYKSNNRIWPLNPNDSGDNPYDWGSNTEVELDKVSVTAWDEVTGEEGDKMVATLKYLILA